MQTKLTLRLDIELIERVKLRSEKTGKSISQLVADYFRMLEKKPNPSAITLPPTTRSLKGMLRGKKISEQDYKRHLEQKHL